MRQEGALQVLLTLIALIFFSMVVQGAFAASYTVRVEDAALTTDVYKQPGDFVNIVIWASSSGSASLSYNNDLKLVGGDSNSVSLSLGRNVLKFYIPEDADTGFYSVTVGSTTVSFKVITNPSLIIITHRNRLFQRYGQNSNSQSGTVISLLAKAYEKADDGNGIVYDLGNFDSMPEYLWSSYSQYSEEPLSPEELDNSYAVSAGIFVQSRCKAPNCENVLVLGDDYVVPYYRRSVTMTQGWLWNQGEATETIYTDLSYIPTKRMYFSDLDSLFPGSQVTIVTPSYVSSELNNQINDLKNDLKSEYNVVVNIKSSYNLACNSYLELGGTLVTKNLILIGNADNNRAIACLPWVESGESTISIERNVWGNKGSAIVLETDGKRLDSILTLRKLMAEQDKDEFDFGSAVVACLWDGKFEGEHPMMQEVSCNMIPIVELAPDFRDSIKCLLESEKTTIDEFVCKVNHFATFYDLAGYGAAFVSFGAGGVAAEVGDTGVSVLKVGLKNAAEGINDPKVLKAAADSFDGLSITKKVKHTSSLADIVYKNPAKYEELTESWIKIISKGDGVTTTTFKAIDIDVVDVKHLMPDKFADYAEGVKIAGYADPLTDGAGVHKVVKAFNAPGVVTNVIDPGSVVVKQIDGMAILKQGEHIGPNSGFGQVHMVKEGHYDQIKNAFGLADNNKAVDEFIQEGLEKGTKSGNTITWDVPNNEHNLKIILSDTSPGSIQIARPD
ncbi:MAG: hypothetical protein ABIG20_03690 [archaeon]